MLLEWKLSETNNKHVLYRQNVGFYFMLIYFLGTLKHSKNNILNV